MNVFHRFTRASLRQNRSRTLVTIIGITLSMALVTAVIQGAYSGVQFLVRSEESGVGAFHGYYYDLTAEEAAQVRQADFVKKSAAWHLVGWAEIGSQNEYKPYLLLRSVSEDFTNLVAVHLSAGRLPQTPEEILLPEHLSTNGGVTYPVGSTLTLQVGRRVSDGYALSEYNTYAPEQPEELSDTVERTYTVVGVYQRFDNQLEDFSCPGYTALTGWDGEEAGEQSVFFTVKKISRFYDSMAEQTISENWRAHDDLLRLSGAVRAENLTLVLYGFAGVLIFLIAFGSISLIYNSFAISISERTQQFGILKSVGATKKQIRDSVLYEAVLLGGAGIVGGAVVGCAGIGITLWALRDAFSMFVLGGGITVPMKLVITPLGLLIAAAVCMATTLLSAWITAQRANRVSAIDAIRQSRDIRIKGKSVKVSSLTKKIFGFEGMMASKNFKRNRKRYRATVVSLFLSITLFISASSFCDYLTNLVHSATSSSMHYDVGYTVYGDSGLDQDRLLKLMQAAQGVTASGYVSMASRRVCVPSGALSAEMAGGWVADDDESNEVGVYLQIAFLDDALFRRLCADNGISADAFYAADTSPGGLLYNRQIGATVDAQSGERRWYNVSVLQEEKLPLEAYWADVRSYEGYTLLETDAEAGLYYYYPFDYVDEWLTTTERNTLSYDRSRAMVKTAEEAEERTYFTIGGTVSQTPFLLSPDQPTVLYPYAMRQAVLGEGIHDISWYTIFGVKAANHAQVYETLRKTLIAEGIEPSPLHDYAEIMDAERMLVTVVQVFSYGFIILISLIAMANVFNTISTNVMLRRREFAMLKSIGLGERGFRKMMNYECLIYGCKGLLWGLPAAVGMTFLIYRVTVQAMEGGFYIPWYSVAIAVGSVFAVVFATMLYATRAIRRDNPIDALKQENL